MAVDGRGVRRMPPKYNFPLDDIVPLATIPVVVKGMDPKQLHHARHFDEARRRIQPMLQPPRKARGGRLPQSCTLVRESDGERLHFASIQDACHFVGLPYSTAYTRVRRTGCACGFRWEFGGKA